MTKEQEEIIIEELEQLIEKTSFLREEEFYTLFTIHEVQNIASLLNMLKEKESEIEKYKQLYNKALDDAVITAHDNMKKDKMIDLIIDFFYKLTQESPGTTIHYLEKNGFDTSKCNNCSPGNDCRKCFKQYFERKAKDGRL